jgi:hypothetical protein
MEDLSNYKRSNFIALMRQKRGIHFTFGWLENAYAQHLDAGRENQIIDRELPLLQAMPDYAN